MNLKRNTSPRLGGRVVMTTVASLAAGVALVGCSTGSNTPAVTSRPDTSVTSSSAAGMSSSGSDFADGSYTATGQYGGQPSHIVVDLTLVGGNVTSVTVTPTATNDLSLDYQQRFADAVPDVVVGRPLSEVHVDHLAGSSATPDGFNDAIEQIKRQAADR